MRRLVFAFLLWLVPGGAFAMGEVPGDENLCKTILSSLQSQQPLSAEAVAFAEEYRGRALQRQAVMEQNLDMIDGELQVGGSWDPSAEETDYLRALDISLALLSAELSRVEEEILCWDEILRHPRIPNPPKPPLPIVRTKSEPKPPPLPDPNDPIGLGELWDKIADYNGWQRFRAEDQRERIEDWRSKVDEELSRRVIWRDRFESGNLGAWAGISGSGSIPLDEPDFGATQEIDENMGGAVELDGGLSLDLGAPWRLEVGAGVGWRRQGLDELLNKNLPGSLPLEGHDGGFYGLGELGLRYQFSPEGYLRLGGGVGAARRQLDLSANGNQVVDDGDTVLLWRIEGAAGWRLCDCGLFLEGLVRYETLGEAKVISELDVPFTLGAQRSLLLGLGLRYQFGLD
jgi:hypothetical protein